MLKKRVVIILQARMGSSRLPGKPLKKVLGKVLLSYQLERLRRVEFASELIVATTSKEEDNSIEELCLVEAIPCFRGSELDVLDRYYQAAKQFQAETVIRVTGDCPLIDPLVVDQVIEFYLNSFPKYDYVSNSLERTYPRGLDVEIFSFALLEQAAKEAKLKEEREHVTLYFYTHPELFSLGNLGQSKDQSYHRWTVDTPEDLDLIAKILMELYPKIPCFTTDDILKVFDHHPDWIKINAHIQQKAIAS